MGLDSVELVMNTEEHFGIEIPDHIAETLFTVGDLHDFVVAELHRSGRARDAEAVFSELRELICDQLGIEPERVVPAARFVQDLRID
jgi:acyl carrier protein